MMLLAAGMAKADDKAWYLCTDANVNVALADVD